MGSAAFNVDGAAADLAALSRRYAPVLAADPAVAPVLKLVTRNPHIAPVALAAIEAALADDPRAVGLDKPMPWAAEVMP